jgi:hypothetical protein
MYYLSNSASIVESQIAARGQRECKLATTLNPFNPMFAPQNAKLLLFIRFKLFDFMPLLYKASNYLCESPIKTAKPDNKINKN